MARYQFTNAARADLRSIGQYTLDNWGMEQVDRYFGELEADCQRLADIPALGRVYRQPYLRFPSLSHVVFFRRDEAGDIVVVRILHKRMLPELHFKPSRDDEHDPDE